MAMSYSVLIEILRALGVALGILLVPIARALVLVPISPRRNTIALLAAYATVLQAPVLPSCFRAPYPTLGVTETLMYIIPKKKKKTYTSPN